MSVPSVLRRITPVVLTYNEEPNLRRCLESLEWAERIVVLDSGSTDRTEEIARSFPNVTWATRTFDRHREQWAHAIWCASTSEFVLALDADMAVTAETRREIERVLADGVAGGVFAFEYRYVGRALRGSVYPPQLRLFRPHEVHITQEGHTQRFHVSSGRVHRFRSRLVHDDRKPLERWLTAQLNYSRLEADRIRRAGPPSLRDFVRRAGMGPLAIGLLAYARAGGPLGGLGALRYTWERVSFEALLAIRLLDHAR